MKDDCIPVPLNIPGRRVIGCGPGELAGLEVEVESEAKGGLCPECGAAALVPEERPMVLVRDLPIHCRPTWLRWRKRRYECPACGRSFTEAHVPPIACRCGTAHRRTSCSDRIGCTKERSPASGSGDWRFESHGTSTRKGS